MQLLRASGIFVISILYSSELMMYVHDALIMQICCLLKPVQQNPISNPGFL